MALCLWGLTVGLCGPDCESVWSCVCDVSTDQLVPSCNHVLSVIALACSVMLFVLLERLRDSVLVLLSVVAGATLCLCCCPVLALLSVANWCHDASGC